jgi:hypothetical protein
VSAVTIDFNGWNGLSVDAVTWGVPVAPPTVQVEPEEPASNWQAHYHYPRNRRLTKEEERRQRIALGIIEEEFEAADEAVKGRSNRPRGDF